MKKQNCKMTRIACLLLLLAGTALCGQEKNPAKKAPAMPAMPSPTVGVAKVFTAEDVLVRNYVGQTVSVAVAPGSLRQPPSQHPHILSPEHLLQHAGPQPED